MDYTNLAKKQIETLGYDEAETNAKRDVENAKRNVKSAEAFVAIADLAATATPPLPTATAALTTANEALTTANEALQEVKAFQTTLEDEWHKTDEYKLKQKLEHKDNAKAIARRFDVPTSSPPPPEVVMKRAKDWTTSHPKYDITVHIGDDVTACMQRNEISNVIRRLAQDDYSQSGPRCTVTVKVEK